VVSKTFSIASDSGIAGCTILVADGVEVIGSSSSKASDRSDVRGVDKRFAFNFLFFGVCARAK